LAVGCRYLNDGRKQRGWQAFFLPTVETQGKTVSVEDKLLTIPITGKGEIPWKNLFPSLFRSPYPSLEKRMFETDKPSFLCPEVPRLRRTVVFVLHQTSALPPIQEEIMRVCFNCSIKCCTSYFATFA